jgi:nitrate reductase alpha subunit
MPRTGTPARATRAEDACRSQIAWDQVRWGAHRLDCYPGNCPKRVFMRGGRVWREEQAATFTTIGP